MGLPIAFYSRCKPQHSDAIEIVLATKRIFIGYPMAKTGTAYDPYQVRSCTADPSSDKDDWLFWHGQSDRNRQYNQNRNLVSRVGIGSIAMVPRPQLGVIYCGRVTKPFELVDTPSWYDDYMALRERQGLSRTDDRNTWHAGDIAQCWEVDDYRPIPIPKVPAWIRRSMFGRSTYGVISSQEGVDRSPYEVLSEIIDSAGFALRPWTVEQAEVERRLLADLSPSSFEHLVVALLQLERPAEIWTHVGGSGDGGVDGVGASASGSVCGLLQCKWQYWGEQVFKDETPWGAVAADATLYLAALAYPTGVRLPANCTFWDRSAIARLVIKHRDKLPIAISLRVGSGQGGPPSAL